MSGLVRDPWQGLRELTPARLALGRSGDALPTQRWLEFGVAHAQARDAVHAALDVQALLRELAGPVVAVTSAAADRAQYLRRPDLGRQLSPAGREAVAGFAAALPATPRPLAVVIADGLSAVAVQRHALPVLQALRARFAPEACVPVVVATQARVALGDEVGALLGTDAVAVLIGERPGLSVADSLGIYFTWAPRVGRTDAERNCLSNIHARGMAPAAAAEALWVLLAGARQLGCSGVALVDNGARNASKLYLSATPRT